MQILLKQAVNIWAAYSLQKHERKHLLRRILTFLSNFMDKTDVIHQFQIKTKENPP